MATEFEQGIWKAGKMASVQMKQLAHTSLDVLEVVQLLKLSLYATYFSFRGKYYQQVFGTAMRLPVCVTVASLVMEDVEDRALATRDFGVEFWKRYVDDTCVTLAATNCEVFLDYLNLVEPTISSPWSKNGNESFPPWTYSWNTIRMGLFLPPYLEKQPIPIDIWILVHTTP